MTSTYFVEISKVGTDETDGEALAYGFARNFGVLNYMVKDALKGFETGADYAARIVETDAVNSDEEPKRSVVSVTAEADVVAYVVKKKLAAERKENGEPADPTDPTDGDATV